MSSLLTRLGMTAPAVAAAPDPPRRKRRNGVRSMSWSRIASLVAEETGDFKECIDVAVGIVRDPEVEPKDRLKALEFLAKFAGSNPALQKQSIDVTGEVKHTHVVRPNLSGFSAAELVAYERLMLKAAGETVPDDVIDVTPEPAE